MLLPWTDRIFFSCKAFIFEYMISFLPFLFFLNIYTYLSKGRLKLSLTIIYTDFICFKIENSQIIGCPNASLSGTCSCEDNNLWYVLFYSYSFIGWCNAYASYLHQCVLINRYQTAAANNPVVFHMLLFPVGRTSQLQEYLSLLLITNALNFYLI